MTIKVLVLKSGEDVIADIQEMMSSENQVMGYFLNKPCVVKIQSKVTVRMFLLECIHGCPLHERK